MHAQPKKKAVVENGGDGGIGPGLAAAIANGEDVVCLILLFVNYVPASSLLALISL
jgi:hypothetical protein